MTTNATMLQNHVFYSVFLPCERWELGQNIVVE